MTSKSKEKKQPPVNLYLYATLTTACGHTHTSFVVFKTELSVSLMTINDEQNPILEKS